MNERSELLEFTLQCAVDAGVVLRDYFGGELHIETKSSDIDPVTEADHAAEALILGRIEEKYPDHAILAEESGETAGEGALWLVDPLDGTVNFSHAHPHYSVSIALYEDGAPRLGVIYDPELDELFWAERGHGAWLRRRDGSVHRLGVSEVSRLREGVIGTGFYYQRGAVDMNNIDEVNAIIMRAQGVRRAGSAALDLAYVAANRLQGFWEYFLAPWDLAAGGLLVTEAGGMLYEIDGGEWSPWSESTVAAGPDLMPRLLEVLQTASELDHDKDSE